MIDTTEHADLRSETTKGDRSFARGLLSWFVMGAGLFVVGAYTVDGQPTAGMVFRALLFSAPIMLLVARGHLGRQHLRHPTTALALFVLWQAGLGPSMVACAPPTSLFSFSTDAEYVGVLVYAAWWFLYAIVVGRAPDASEPAPWASSPRTQPLYPFAAIFGLWAVTTALTAIRGHLSNYDPNAPEIAAGGIDAAITFTSISLTPLIPAIAILMWNRCVSPLRIVFTGAMILAALVVLFLAGGRSTFIYAMLVVSVLLRPIGMRMRGSAIVAAGASLLLIFIALIAYRTALQNTQNRARGFSGQVEMASDAVQSVGDANARSTATKEATDNALGRLTYAPTYFVAVDYVLWRGPTFEPTILSGILRSIPSAILPEKNDMANDVELEYLMHRTGRYPNVDLSSTPIAEWVFVLGVFIAPLGGAAYAAMARALDRSLSSSTTMSLARWIVLGAFVKVLMNFDGGGDYLFVGMRQPLALAGLVWIAAKVAASRSGAPRPALQPHVAR